MLSLLGVGLVAIALTLQGCGGGGGTPSPPTPGPPSPSPGPTPPSPSVSGYGYSNTTVQLGPGISINGPGASATISYDLTIDIVNGTVLKKLYMEHKDLFKPDTATLIKAVLDAAGEDLTGPTMSFLIDNLLPGYDFLVAMFSSDSLTRHVRLKGEYEVTSSSRIPRTYYPCIKVLKINAMNGNTLIKTIMGLNSLNVFSCSRFGTHQDEAVDDETNYNKENVVEMAPTAVAVEEVAVEVPVRPCHAILKGAYGPVCDETNRAESCKSWEKPFSCTASGWPVCCIGHSGGDSNNPYWYKADQKCSDLHPDGAAPFAPCKGEPSAWQAVLV